MLLQESGDIRKGSRMGFVRGLPKVFEQDERAVSESHVVLQSNLRSERNAS